MIRSELLDTIDIPGDGGELRLLKCGDDYSIRIAGTPGDLMNSRMHGSEDALGTLACTPFRTADGVRVLIGGLGMGFSLAAALETLPPDARVEVAELVPGIVSWNRGVLAACAGEPLSDARVTVSVEDVGVAIQRANACYHAILLDVDNGPEALTHPQNGGLYSAAGLGAAHRALLPSGVLAIWSSSALPKFTTQLKKAGFTVQERRVRAHNGKGARHMIWLAAKS